MTKLVGEFYNIPRCAVPSPRVSIFLGPHLLGNWVGRKETYEPTIVSKVVAGEKAGAGLGTLSSFRSIGLFTGNLVMGVLYTFSSAYSYAYTTILAVLGGIVVLYFSREYAKNITRIEG